MIKEAIEIPFSDEEIQYLRKYTNAKPGNRLWERAFSLYNDNNEKPLYPSCAPCYIKVLSWILKHKK